MALTCQERAIAHVRARCSGGALPADVRVTLSFHPDRRRDGTLILDALAATGTYRSQFETGTSNGGLTAHPGGDRWSWESRMFGGAYDGEAPGDRPKYGALCPPHRRVGGSPRFGSSHLRLHPDLLGRTTFCFPDSVLDPVCFGVAERMGEITTARAAAHPDPLDDYVEAHVHGPVRLTDVEALVLDPCFRQTEVEAAARRLEVPVEWHPGFVLTTEQLEEHPDFRGPGTVALGLSLAVDGVITPRVIGEAAARGRHPEQELKLLWHCVARFGERAA